MGERGDPHREEGGERDERGNSAPLIPLPALPLPAPVPKPIPRPVRLPSTETKQIAMYAPSAVLVVAVLFAGAVAGAVLFAACLRPRRAAVPRGLWRPGHQSLAKRAWDLLANGEDCSEAWELVASICGCPSGRFLAAISADICAHGCAYVSSERLLQLRCDAHALLTSGWPWGPLRAALAEVQGLDEARIKHYSDEWLKLFVVDALAEAVSLNLAGGPDGAPPRAPGPATAGYASE